MKVIIAGTRTCRDPKHVCHAMEAALAGWNAVVTEVVSGGASGADRLGELWATLADVPYKRFPADWEKYGRGAGPLRNGEMGEYADALVAIWDGKSRGTKNMIDVMKKLGKPVYVHYYEDV